MRAHLSRVPAAIISAGALTLLALAGNGTTAASAAAAGAHPAIAASTAGNITIYSSSGIRLSTAAYANSGIAAGPDGALWFTNPGNNTIGRITTTGQVTSYRGASIRNPWAITAGPVGALWFTNWTTPSIGRISTGGKVSAFTGAIQDPNSITAGPDGALWYTNWSPGGRCGWSIGRMTPQGRSVCYQAGKLGFNGFITPGPDGALWFGMTQGDFGNAIGRITAAGKLTAYRVPKDPYGIAPGPDGALWFLNTGSNTIGRITTAGQVTSYSGPLGVKFVNSNITAGPDGAMWFTNPITNTIGRITTGVTPVISRKMPRSGKPGTLVTIIGRNLARASQVAFNGTPATIISDTATSLVTIVPPGAATGRIAITTPAGTVTRNGWFTVKQ
jgi:virginiamycin B lyase